VILKNKGKKRTPSAWIMHRKTADRCRRFFMSF
jgi:hypothetical protein